MSKVVSYFTKYSDEADNIYEAIMVVAKRARKIGADQKFEIEKILSTSEATEENEEEIVKDNEELLDIEKPTVIAIRELLNGDLEFEYKDKSKQPF